MADTVVGSRPALLAAVEGGGTKFICAVGAGPSEILKQVEIPTTGPNDTLARCIEFFRDAQDTLGPITALGVACFGPLGVRLDLPHWGRMLNTPKIDWRGVDIAGRFGQALGCPVAIDLDVNGAAIAESRYGAGAAAASLAYITVGTGIGAGLLVDGRLVHGLLHPEAGHIRPRRHADDHFPGVCPSHGDCLEGLASGAALIARIGESPARLPDHDPIWEFEADYLAQLCATLTLVASPERIVIGGGVLRRTALFSGIRSRFIELLNAYPDHPAFGPHGIDAYIVAPGLGDKSGIMGGFCLAADAWLGSPSRL